MEANFYSPSELIHKYVRSEQNKKLSLYPKAKFHMHMRCFTSFCYIKMSETRKNVRLKTKGLCGLFFI